MDWIGLKLDCHLFSLFLIDANGTLSNGMIEMQTGFLFHLFYLFPVIPIPHFNR